MSISMRTESRQWVMDDSFVHTDYPQWVRLSTCYILDVLDSILERIQYFNVRLPGLKKSTHTILFTCTNTHVAGVMIIVHLSVVSSGERLKNKLATIYSSICALLILLFPPNFLSCSILCYFFFFIIILPSLPSFLSTLLLGSFFNPHPSLLIYGSWVSPCVHLSCSSQILSASNLCVFCLDSPWKVYLSEVNPAVTKVSVGGLTPARTYQFRLCAVNQVGRGQYSTETQR